MTGLAAVELNAPSRALVFLVGVAVLLAAGSSVLRTVVVPRALPSVISDGLARSLNLLFGFLARRRRTYARRDAVLAWEGPLSILLLLVAWLLLFLVAYALMIYGFSQKLTLGESVRQSGSSLLTLGFADGANMDQTFVDFMAAATGPILIALLIGFLPTIYSAYVEREVEVTALTAQAGEPCWGPELLARSALSDTVDTLPALFDRWARWAATVRMTQLIYPVLNRLRSPRAGRHWAGSLLAVLDGAALQVALAPQLPRAAALDVLIQGSQTFEVLWEATLPTARTERRAWRRSRSAASTAGIVGKGAATDVAGDGLGTRVLAVDEAATDDITRWVGLSTRQRLRRDSDQSVTITRAEFDAAVAMLQRTGFPMTRDADEAWPVFRTVRQRYEYLAYLFCARLQATPAPWSGPRDPEVEVVWPELAVDTLARIEAAERRAADEARRETSDEQRTAGAEGGRDGGPATAGDSAHMSGVDRTDPGHGTTRTPPTGDAAASGSV